MGLCNTTFIVSIQAAVPWNKRGAATSSCLFLRFLGQSLGAASFGALMNATMKRHGPETAHLIDQLMEPGTRALLAPAERAELVGLIAHGLHNAYWLAMALSAATLLLVWFLPAAAQPGSSAFAVKPDGTLPDPGHRRDVVAKPVVQRYPAILSCGNASIVLA